MSPPPYQTSTTSSSSSSSTATAASKLSSQPPHRSPPPPDLDGLLAGAGYKVRSSDLSQVAQRLERLENVMVNAPPDVSESVVHYNPSDIASWVDSLLSEFTQPQFPPPSDLPCNVQQHHTTTSLSAVGNDNNWGGSYSYAPQLTVLTTAVEEDSGIRLVHALMTCAESVQRGEFSLASSLIEEMQTLLTRVNTSCGIGKVAAYFIDALNCRIFGVSGLNGLANNAHENPILYHHFYEACPYLKFAHFTANQAILEAFEGHDCVHVVDFNLMHGLQWPALIQALALRPGGPPSLRLTGIGQPSPDGRDSLREIGLRLAELARSVNVRFAFRGVAALRLEDVKPWMLQVSSQEAVAVNSIMQLHKLLGSDPTQSSPISSVLAWIRSLNPKIVTVIEQESNHNKPEFLDRFTEALYYYSTMFDSLEVCGTALETKALAEMYIQREICNVLCCEGSARVERHEPLVKWRARLGEAGFTPLLLGSNAFKQASMLLTLFSAEGYCVEENQGCLTLGWHSRPLISASAWQAEAVTVTNSNRSIIS